MEKAKVYFTDFRTGLGVSLPDKLKKLIKLAGIGSIDMEGKLVAIKMHFGEMGNIAYLRPNYAKAVADVVKEQGGKPFLTDCNTLYPGYRKNAIDHLYCAEVNGFNWMTTGCPVIIGDGLRGTDDVEIPVRNGEYCRTAFIGKSVMDADIFISLTHFKGHEATGFGGTLKNIGMGCGSRAGKMQQHNSGKPHVITELCRGCRRCARECGSDAISYDTGKAYIDPDICKGCGRCIGACSFDAIENTNENANEILCCKIAEYSQAVCDGRPCFHISLITDVSPNCDCHGENDAPILPNIGMLASFDPVALDQACVDLCQKAEPIRNSQLGDHLANPDWHCHHDHFTDSNPNVRWRETLEHGEKIGLGSREYELVKIKNEVRKQQRSTMAAVREAGTADWERMRAVIEPAEHAIAVYRFVDGRVKTVCISDGLYAMMHTEEEGDKQALIRRFDTDMYRNVVPEDAARLAAEARRFATEGGRYDVVYREKVYQRNRYTLTHAVGYHHYLQDGSRIAVILYTDIEDTEKAHAYSLMYEENALRNFLNQSDLAMAVVTRDRGELLYCNAPMRRLLRPVRNFDTGITLSEWLLGRKDPALLDMVAALDGQGNQLVRFREDEEDVVMRVSSETWEGQKVYFLQSDPWNELFRDALTGLPNLSSFRRQAAEEIRRIREAGSTPALLYFNLFGMKAYNGRYGIREGDRILKVTAALLERTFPEGLVCRTSEDHFMVLGKTQGLEERLSDLCAMVAKSAAGSILQLKAGICDAIPEGTPSEEEISAACDGARLACGRIRENARMSWNRFDDRVREAYEKEAHVLSTYQAALREHWIRVYYQPLVDAATGKLCGFECLSRWEDPDRGLLSPAEFIPVLEQHHLIGLLDQYVLEEICREAGQRADKGLGQIPVSFNISRDDFSYGDICENIRSAADRYGVPHDKLIVEITESAFSDEPELIREQIRRFHENGFQVWMDDFGSEYSSLGTLQTMEVDLIKLDIRFLRSYEEERKTGDGTRAASLLRAVIRMAQELHLPTLCEGVETGGELALLREAGCNWAQGFCFGRPAPIEKIQTK